MSFINEVQKHVPYEAPISPKEAQFAQNMFQGLTGFMLQTGKKLIEWDRQDKLIADERKWQKEMFNLENAYNSPVAMAQRMRHAGLNPYAMTGQQVAGSFNSGSYPSTIPMEDPFENIVKAAQIANINADTEVKKNEAEISFQEARKKAVEADNWPEYWKVTIDNAQLEGELTEQEIQKVYAEALKEFALARKAQEDANQFEEFGKDGGNVYGDASALSQSQTGLNIATSGLVKEQTTTEGYKREFYTASSENQKSMAVKNYAESRLIKVRTDIESVFGALQAEANLNKTQLESQVIVPLADSLIALQDATAQLAKDNVRHNHVVENIQKEANQINSALMKIKQNEFYYSMFKDFCDRMLPDVNKLLSSIAGLL